ERQLRDGREDERAVLTQPAGCVVSERHAQEERSRRVEPPQCVAASRQVEGLQTPPAHLSRPRSDEPVELLDGVDFDRPAADPAHSSTLGAARPRSRRANALTGRRRRRTAGTTGLTVAAATRPGRASPTGPPTIAAIRSIASLGSP